MNESNPVDATEQPATATTDPQAELKAQYQALVQREAEKRAEILEMRQATINVFKQTALTWWLAGGRTMLLCIASELSEYVRLRIDMAIIGSQITKPE